MRFLIPLVVFSCVPAVAQRTIDTVAGGYMPNSVPARGVELISISGLTGDAQGNLYFADSRYVIRRISRDGTIQTIAGNGVSAISGDGGPATSASLGSPTKLTTDPEGNLYFLDYARIRRVDSSGKITTVAGTGIHGSLGGDGPATLAEIDPPGDIAAGNDGTVYLSESNDHRIRKLTPDGRILFVAGAPQPAGAYPLSDGDGGPASAAHLNYPSAIAADRAGNIYLAEANQKIRRIASDGTISTLASGLSSIRSLAVGAQGELYVGDCPSSVAGTPVLQAPCQIRRVRPDGTIDTVAGGPSTAPTTDGPASSVLLGGLTGLFVDSAGDIYFSDTYPGQIRRVTPQSMVETVAGGSPVYAPDGPDARQAWLVSPIGIATDRSGNLYIAEDCVIRKVAPNGAFTKVAGTGKCASAAQEGPVGTTDLPHLFDLAVTNQGQIYISDLSGHLLTATPGKTITLVTGIGGTGGGMRLAVDSKDRLYGLGLQTKKVMRLQIGAAPETYVAGAGASVFVPIGSNPAMTIDAADNLYISFGPNGGFANQMVYVVKPDGIAGYFAGFTAALALESIAFTGKVCGTNRSLFGFDYYPGAGFRGDGGPLASALANLPMRLVAAGSGDFYFIDSNNRRIRKITGSPPKSAPVFSAEGVVNAASGRGGPVAPGELISVYGTNLGPASAAVNVPENNGYPGVAGYAHLVLGSAGPLSNGSNMPILLASTSQINAFVPYTVSGATTIRVEVEVDGALSGPVDLKVAESAFGLFTADGSGSGQGAILNQDGAYNTTANPASRGSVVSLYGTGDGLETPAASAGSLVLSTPYPTTAVPVNVTIGGQPAEVLYAGAAPFLPAGITQINVRIPQDVVEGDAPIIVSIAGVPTTQAVTVAVR